MSVLRRCGLLVVLLLVTRVLVALGPEGFVVCVHGGGGVFFESEETLCCARPECSTTRTAPGEAPSDPDDDCQDYVITTIAAPEKVQPSVAPLVACLEPAPPVLVTDAPAFAPAPRATDVASPPLRRALPLRC